MADEFVKDDRVYALEERKRRQSDELMAAASHPATRPVSRRGSDDGAAVRSVGPAALGIMPTTPMHNYGMRGQKRKSGEASACANAAAARAEELGHAAGAGRELGDAAGGITDEALALLHDAPWVAEETAASNKR